MVKREEIVTQIALNKHRALFDSQFISRLLVRLSMCGLLLIEIMHYTNASHKPYIAVTASILGFFSMINNLASNREIIKIENWLSRRTQLLEDEYIQLSSQTEYFARTRSANLILQFEPAVWVVLITAMTLLSKH